MNQKKFDYKLSLAIIGEPSTGKTNIFKRFLPFGSKYDWDNTLKPTTDIDFLIDSRQIDNQSVRVIVLDMGPALRWIKENFYQKVHGFLVVYDITNRNSFEKIRIWIEKVQFHNRKNDMKYQIILIGNKCDLEEEREVTYEEGRVIAEEYGMRFFEVSAKTSENIDFVMKMFKREEIRKLKENEKVKKEEEVKKAERSKLWGANDQKKKSLLSAFAIGAGAFSAYLVWDIFFGKTRVSLKS